MNLAYSYIRFSSPKQQLGDSLRRQLALSEAYASKHGLVLDTSTYRDLGVSAFDKTNLEKGALAAFLEAVKSGAVPKGAFLLVENLDRLSRAYVHTAFTLLTGLVEAGITVVTLTDEKVWDSESIKDITALLTSILIFHRAHDESQQKSKRLCDAWSDKRDKAYCGELPTSEVPRWLKIKSGRTGVEVIPELVASIEKVFELVKSGFGATAIARKANKGGWPAPSTSGKWHLSLISRLVNNRALLGEFQPHKVMDGKRVPIGDPIKLFPAVIGKDVWDSVHLSRRLKKEMPNRRDAQYKNLFQGILLCGHCGASLVRKQKAPDDRPSGFNKPGYTRYYCADRTLGITKCPSCSAEMVEGALLTQVLTNAGNYLSQTDEVAKKLSSDVDKYKAEYEGFGMQIESLADAVAKTGSIQALIDRLNAAHKAQNEAQEKLRDSEAKLNALVVAEDSYENISAVAETMKSADPAGRAALREKILRLITRIWVWPDKGLAAIEMRATGVVVGALLGVAAEHWPENIAKVFDGLKIPVRESGRVRRKPT